LTRAAYFGTLPGSFTKEKNMTLTEIVEKISTEKNLPKHQVHEVLSRFFNIVEESTVTNDENVKLYGFGVFSKKLIKPRKTPQGGMSAPRTTIRFKASR
jgi:nucleoid DNA-binding protein